MGVYTVKTVKFEKGGMHHPPRPVPMVDIIPLKSGAGMPSPYSTHPLTSLHLRLPQELRHEPQCLIGSETPLVLM